MWMTREIFGENWHKNSGECYSGTVANRPNGNREIGHLEQSVYCIRKALKCEPDQIDLLWDLGAIYRIQGQKTRVGLLLA